MGITKTYVVLPAFNEAAALSKLVPRIAQTLKDANRPFEVIVVNDGSSDETSGILNAFSVNLPCREIRHSQNQGYGAALQTGLLFLAGHAQDDEAIITMDADNTQDPIYIPGMIEKLEQGFDAVTASYTMAGGRLSGVPWMRRLMSQVINALFGWIAPLPGVRTYTNGFRAYRSSILKKVHHRYGDHLIEESGFPGGTEFFMKMAGQRGKIAEIPFVLHYEERGSGSKIKLFLTIRKYLKLLRSSRCYV